MDPTHYRLWIDAFRWGAGDALRAACLTIEDDDRVLLPAGSVKHPWQLPYLREAMRRVNADIRAPEEHQKSRNCCIGHRPGMAGELPNEPHWKDGDDYAREGQLAPGMVLCLEGYIGWDRSAEEGKPEDQFLILEDRIERMSDYPFDSRLGWRAVQSERERRWPIV